MPLGPLFSEGKYILCYPAELADWMKRRDGFGPRLGSLVLKMGRHMRKDGRQVTGSCDRGPAIHGKLGN